MIYECRIDIENEKLGVYNFLNERVGYLKIGIDHVVL